MLVVPKRPNKYIGGIVVVTVAAVGIISLVVSHAAGNSQASGGKAVKFGASSGSNPLSGLPLIPWEGGPAYWDQFPVAKAAGWSDPSFFPFVIWHNPVESSSDGLADKGYGINSYVGMADIAEYSWFADSGQFILQKPSNAPIGGPAWPGDFLDDETDGTSPTLRDALARVKQSVAQSGEDGRFKEFNFTQIVGGDYGADNNDLSAKIINAYNGPVSLDSYWYTSPNCMTAGNYSLNPIDTAHCRTSSSYGITVRNVRDRDAVDGKPKPVWNFVEDLTGAPDPNNSYANITPGQLAGAVMDSVINEARGILYFNQALGGTCQTTQALRDVTLNLKPCAVPQIEAMKTVNLLIKSLAPVINTQSYQYSFGPQLDAMLKWYSGSAYVFAMVSGDATSQPGSRTFTLPAGLTNPSKIEVLNESRTITPNSGSFTDSFAAEYTYHIYKIIP